MFGLGWSEMVIVGIVALIVIGPKDLPGMFRTLGQFTGKARAMASEFSRAMEAAADDAGVKDISKSIKTAANPKQFGIDKIREATGTVQKGPETQKLSEERQEAKAKIMAASAKKAEERKAREAAAAAAEEPAPAPDTADKDSA